MYILGVVLDEVTHPSAARKPGPDQTAKEIELAQWKAIELFKVRVLSLEGQQGSSLQIALNFFQVTAVAISINVEWTKPMVVLFKTAGDFEKTVNG